jgi:hypothetical protein
MRRHQIRCYEAFVEGAGVYNNRAFYSAGDTYRSALATCTAYGEVFIVDREDPGVGNRLLTEVRADRPCPACGVPLYSSLSSYPTTFRAENGRIGSCEEPTRIPPDQESVVLTLWALTADDWGERTSA